MDLAKSLLEWGDPYFVLADYRAYVETQEKINLAYGEKQNWAKWLSVMLQVQESFPQIEQSVNMQRISGILIL